MATGDLTPTNVKILIYPEEALPTASPPGSSAALYCNDTAELKVSVYIDPDGAEINRVDIVARYEQKSYDDDEIPDSMPPTNNICYAYENLYGMRAHPDNQDFSPSPADVEGMERYRFGIRSQDWDVYDESAATKVINVMAKVNFSQYVSNPPLETDPRGEDLCSVVNFSDGSIVMDSSITITLYWQPAILLEAVSQPISGFDYGSVYQWTAKYADGYDSQYPVLTNHTDYVGGDALNPNYFSAPSDTTIMHFSSRNEGSNTKMAGFNCHGYASSGAFSIRTNGSPLTYNFNIGNGIISMASYQTTSDSNQKPSASDDDYSCHGPEVWLEVQDLYGRRTWGWADWDQQANGDEDGYAINFTQEDRKGSHPIAPDNNKMARSLMLTGGPELEERRNAINRKGRKQSSGGSNIA